MFFLRLTCQPADIDVVSAELWEAGTAGIQEIDSGESSVLLAGFPTNERRDHLFRQFGSYSPEWDCDDSTDWVRQTQEAWPPRCVGRRLFLAAPWREDATPAERCRVIHNPGLACGTGEHPCTQLALEALEDVILPGNSVVDVGTGSGLLAIAALRLGAAKAIGIDIDEAALRAARENFELNQLSPLLAAGSADTVQSGSADIVIANISATVLLAIAGDLVRIVKPSGSLILTGFPEWELSTLREQFATAAACTEVRQINEWHCFIAKLKVPSPVVLDRSL